MSISRLVEITKKFNRKHSFKKGIKKTDYEKTLEKENFELKAKLAYYQELEKLVNIDNKKK